MSTGLIDSNGSTASMTVKEDATHVALAGAFDGATVALEQDINGTWYPVLDSDSVAIEYTEAVDDSLYLGSYDLVRLTTSGGGGSLAVDWRVSGTRVNQD